MAGRPKKSPIPVYHYTPDEQKLIEAELTERRRLCDPEAIAAAFKALARIRRKAMLARAERCA